jgi:integral membrane sensor domain MASE1/two-component sensor histidine kinase
MDSQPTRLMSSSPPEEANSLPHFLFQIGGIALGVFLLSQAGEWFLKSSGGLLSPIWPAAGFALAVAVLYGLERAVPAVYLGSLASNLLNGEPTAFLYAGPIGYVVELLVGWVLVARTTRIDLGFPSLEDFVKFVAVGCVPGPLLGALYGTALLSFSEHLSVSQMISGFTGFFQTNAYGILVFCPFFLFALRRQDFRPQTAAGRYELLGYMLALAGLIFFLVHVPEIGLNIRLAAIGATLVLSLAVALRFGLRITVLFQALSIFLVPTFAAMVPGRIGDVRVLMSGAELQPLVHLFAFLASLGCLMAAAFHDELATLRLKFALAMSSADLCVWDWSPSGWACHTPAWREKFGVGFAKAIPDETVLSIIHPDDAAAFRDNFRQLTSSALSHWSQSCRMRDAEGNWVSVQIDARPMRRTADDAVASVAGVMRDTTHEMESVRNRITAIETEAQLRTLRSQINPHFLFNALNSIRALIGRQDVKAKSMITSLGSLLREVLAGRDAKLLSIEKELEIVRDYLEVEAIRFGDRIRYRIDCPAELLPQRIPGMLILTLVENSVKHGISKLEKGGAIDIMIGLTPDETSVIVFVVNDGQLKPQTSGANGYGGQGLENVRERITLSTDGRGSFEIHEIPGPRVEVIALLPFDRRYLPAGQEAGQERLSAGMHRA